jgi:antitoxin component YwqK of YwqJK toxin-antitoxin module
MRILVLMFLALATGPALHSQADSALVAQEFRDLPTDAEAGASEATDPYEALNRALGGDSIRQCQGHPCSGWVEDRWPNGDLKHRGYYDGGRLLIYKNHFENGAVEREFKMLDGKRSQLRTYHRNGSLRSEALFVDGVEVRYEDHYANGQLRYAEEHHRTEPYYLRMDLFAPDGKPISTLHIVDKKKVIFEQQEYYPNGQLRSSGRAQYDPGLHDSRRIGTWTYYNTDGTPSYEEHYVEGKVHERKELH